MKKLKLKLDGKEMLSKTQMKQITGGGYSCSAYANVWTAHNGDWTTIVSPCTSEADAVYNMNAQGLDHYCHDGCLTSCCSAHPWWSGC